MGKQFSVQMTKMFTGDIQDVIIYCAKKINEMKLWQVEDMNVEEGRIVCLYAAGIARQIATIDNSNSITLSFNETSKGVECMGAFHNPQGSNFMSKPIEKMMLKKFFEHL